MHNVDFHCTFVIGNVGAQKDQTKDTEECAQFWGSNQEYVIFVFIYVDGFIFEDCKFSDHKKKWLSYVVNDEGYNEIQQLAHADKNP